MLTLNASLEVELMSDIWAMTSVDLSGVEVPETLFV